MTLATARWRRENMMIKKAALLALVRSILVRRMHGVMLWVVKQL